MPSSASEPRSARNLRLLLICLSAASASMPMAWISIAKILVFLAGLVYLAIPRLADPSHRPFASLWTPGIILAILAAFSLSLLWTSVEAEFALTALAKHGKLLEILLLIALIRTPDEARVGIATFIAGHVLVLLGSWALAAGISLPGERDAYSPHVLFAKSYLDQSIMFAVVAAILWHLRPDKPWLRGLAGLLAIAALLNVFLLQQGRTGYAIAIAMLSLAVMWQMSQRLRLAALVITPTLLLSAIYLGSVQVQERLTILVNEGRSYLQVAEPAELKTSLGWRLNAWHRSIQAIQEKPVIGHGVGSWTPVIKRQGNDEGDRIFGKGNASNPHQEYLLWGVELGVSGILLLLLFLACLARDAMGFPPPVQRATLSVVVAMAMACMFNSTLYDSLIGDFFCISLGLLLALGTTSYSTLKANA